VAGDDLAAVGGGEPELVGSDPGDRELAFVVAPVVEAAEGEEVVEGRRAAACPVL